MKNDTISKKDFYQSWHFLNSHSEFNTEEFCFMDCLDVSVVKVNLETNSIDDDFSKNTKVEFWLECGPREYCEDFGRIVPTHDLDLDCGGETFEDAIIELARLVSCCYGETIVPGFVMEKPEDLEDQSLISEIPIGIISEFKIIEPEKAWGIGTVCPYCSKIQNSKTVVILKEKIKSELIVFIDCDDCNRNYHINIK